MTTTRFRLSFAQERLFFIDQLDPGSSAYHVVNVLRLTGPIDRTALERAIAFLVGRHEALRTRFGQNKHGTPFQVIDDAPPDVLTWVDAGDLSTGALDAAVRTASFAPFDLARGPLLRVTVFRRGAAEHILSCAVHHIVFDGWSWGVFVGELAQAYDAFARGAAPDLPSLRGRYVDFASWQRKSMEAGQLASDLAFWRAELAEGRFVLDLPTARPRPIHPTFAGGALEAHVPLEEATRLRSLAAARGATPFIVLLAAFYVWLSRHTGTRDIVVGTPVAGRTRRAAEEMIGFFVNTLPLRASWRPGTTFAGLVDAVKSTVQRAFEHQDVPLAKLVEILNPERDRSRSPLFQVTFTMDVPVRESAPAGLGLEPYRIDELTAPFDVSMACRERADGAFDCVLSYSTDLFDRRSAERMLGRWEWLLGECIRRPDAPIESLACVGPDESIELDRLSRGPRDAVTWAPLPRRASEIARREPQALAVRDGARSFTYAAWEARTNQLAHRLRALGVGPDDVVGVSMERSAELVAGAWAAMKAGAAFTPLDPELPEGRLADMASDVSAEVVLTARAGGARWTRLGRHVIEVDLDADASGPSEPPDVTVSGDGLAYVIFTSGSTGRPKAAMNTHRGLGTYLEREQREWPLRPGDVMVYKAPCSFDLSVHEMFCPLMNGATLEIARPGGHRDPRYLAELFAARHVSTCLFVPSMLGAFLDEVGASGCPDLTHVMSAGEALPPALAARFRAALPRVRLVNGYGPAETCPTVTKHVCDDELAEAARTPIGRPPSDVTVYVVDPRLERAPVLVAGEICVAGVQVGRGYFRRPELTAERFVPDPYASEPGARMYRTGDRGRFDAAGRLEYLERFDHQIKLRGMRIELGEIEFKLAELPEVRACAVALRRDVPGQELLAAYVVPAAGATIAAGPLREALGRSLPAYMIPTTFTALDALPVNPNGKVDRARLPSPATDAIDHSTYVAPRTSIETELAAVWADVLGRPRIGVRDDFFHAGGHSLLALTLLSRIERQLAVRVPLAALFEEPTVERMAREIERGAVPPDAWLVPLRLPPEGIEPRTPLFVLPGVSGDPRHLAILARELDPRRPVHGLFAAWRESLEAPPDTLEGFADAYLRPIRAMRPAGPYRLCGFSAGCAIAWEIADRLHAAGEEVEQLVLIDGLSPGMIDASFSELARAHEACLDAARGGAVRLSDLRARHDSPALAQLVGFGLGGSGGEADPVLGERDHALVRVCAATMRAIGRAQLRRYPGRAVLVVGTRNPEHEEVRRGWTDVCAALEVIDVDADHDAIVAREPFLAEVAGVVERGT